MLDVHKAIFLLFHIRAILANPLHHVGRWSLIVEFAFHKIHVGSHVFEKPVIPGAQVVESRFAGCRAGKSVLRAFAVAGEQEIALFAL